MDQMHSHMCMCHFRVGLGFDEVRVAKKRSGKGFSEKNEKKAITRERKELDKM